MRKEKIYIAFVDFKATFNTVDRKKLWEIMEEFGSSKYLMERIKKLYEDTKVRIGEEYTEEFWTVKGLRQGCTLSPILFCIYIAGIEEKLKNRNIGDIKIISHRIWSLSYADDLIIMAKNRKALQDMVDTLKGFLKERKLILSQEKTKVIVFNRGRNSKKDKWFYDGKELEEVNLFKYLGFTFNKEGSYKNHIKDLIKKGICASKSTWGLGENKFKNFKKKNDL